MIAFCLKGMLKKSLFAIGMGGVNMQQITSNNFENLSDYFEIIIYPSIHYL